MKRCLVSALLVVMLLSIIPIDGYALDNWSNIDELLSPYMLVIQEVNVKYGVVLKIPQDSEDSVYDRIRAYSPTQYKLRLINQLSGAVAEQNSDYANLGPVCTSIPTPDQTTIMPYAVVDDYEEYKSFGLGLLVRLNGTIRSITGDIGTFYFTSISAIHASEDEDYPGFHYYPISSSYQLLNSNKQCKVTIKCGKRNPEGIILTGLWYPNKTYSAG